MSKKEAINQKKQSKARMDMQNDQNQQKSEQGQKSQSQQQQVKKSAKKIETKKDAISVQNQSSQNQEGQDLFNKPVRQVDDKGQAYWSLNKQKRISVSQFKGHVNVNIRQYYEKDGDWFPTKKGITLSPQLWDSLKALIKDVDNQIIKKTSKNKKKK